MIGNGNVALDVARIMSLDPDRLAATDINPRALEALRHSRIEEVVVVGRRGPEHSSFTLPELVGLSNTPGVALSVNADEFRADAADRRIAVLMNLRTPAPTDRRITLRYFRSPTRITGSDRVTGVEFARAGPASRPRRSTPALC